MRQESTTDPLGNKVLRFIATLESGKEVVTWAANSEAAKEKVLARGRGLLAIRAAGSPLEDRPRKDK